MTWDPVLCDLDGTLVDSAPAIVASLRVACEHVGVKLDPAADLTWCVGPPLEDSLSQLIRRPDSLHPALAAYRASYLDQIGAGMSPMPGAIETIQAMHAEGVTLAVVTYKPKAMASTIVQGSGFEGLFRYVVGRELDGDRRTKAELLSETLGRLRPHRGRPLYIGDHAEDHAAAVSCGVDYLQYGPATWSEILEHVRGTTPASR